jgi:hypothetical protein
LKASEKGLLGGDNNGSGPMMNPGGHRSVDWDAPIVLFDMPGDLFAKTVTQGCVISSHHNEFRVSNPSTEGLEDKDERLWTPNPVDSVSYVFILEKPLLLPSKSLWVPLLCRMFRTETSREEMISSPWMTFSTESLSLCSNCCTECLDLVPDMNVGISYHT